MKLSDLNFIEIKTKRSPTSLALDKITSEKLKPYYNAVYQLLDIKNKKVQSFHQYCEKLQNKIKTTIPSIIIKRRINQQTLQFKILKPLSKKKFQQQTKAFSLKKSKSQPKSKYLSFKQQSQQEQKVKLNSTFTGFRKLAKSFSQTIVRQKTQYNILDKTNKLLSHHYHSLELDGRFMGHIDNIFDNRYRIQSSKQLENLIISTDEEMVSLLRRQKSKYLCQQGTRLTGYRGVDDKEIKQCERIISKDEQLRCLSLYNEVESNDVNEVKVMHRVTRSRLQSLWEEYIKNQEKKEEESTMPHTAKLSLVVNPQEQRSPILSRIREQHKEKQKIKMQKIASYQNFKLQIK